jgi:hypothetical protein
MGSQRLGGGRFAGHPGVEIAGRQREPAQCLEQGASGARRSVAAMHPVQLELGPGRQFNLVGLVVHLRQHQCAGARRQFGQAPRDRWQRGVVADQQVPVEIGRHDEGAARSADAEHIAHAGLLGPARGRPGLVNCEVELERACCRVVVPRRVVAHRGLGAFRPGRAVRSDRRQAQFAGLRVRKEELGVVVEARAGEAGELIAAERDAHQVRRHAPDGAHLEPAKAQLVAHAAWQAVGGGGGGGEIGHGIQMRSNC